MVIAYTGHRKFKNPLMVRADLVQRIRNQKERYPDLTIISGMAVGLDQWVAQECVALGIPFIAAIPFEGQDRLWPNHVQKTYRDLLSKAKEVVVVCQGGFSVWKLQTRNEYMVDNCQLLTAYMERSDSGTGNCVHYANLVERPIEWGKTE